MLLALGRRLFDYHWSVISVWLLLVLTLKTIAPSWSDVARDGDLEHLPADTTTVQGKLLSAKAFPDDRTQSQIVFVFAREDRALTIDDRQFAYSLARQIENRSDLPIVDVWTEKTPVVGRMLRSRSGQAERILVRLTNEFMATDNIRILKAMEGIVESVRDEAPEGLQIGISGSAAIGGDMLSAAASSVSNTHRTTILLVAIALLAIYRSPWLVLVPLLTIALATSASMDLLAILTQWTSNDPFLGIDIRIFTTTKIFVIVLLFGAGTDYCLFLTARFREQRETGLDHREALATALEHVGVALAASALTTIVGLAMMAWAEFGKFTYSGPAIAICLVVTLAACLTLVPALLATRLGAVVGTQDKQRQTGSVFTFWETLANKILRRPGTILVASILLAIPLAWIGSSATVTYDLLGELDPQRVSRRGTALLRKHFAPGEIGPLVVLAHYPPGELASVDGRFTIAELAKPLDDLPGIDQVRSLYQPTGAPPGSVRLFSSEGLQDLAAKGSPLTQAAFVAQHGELAGKVTRLFLILKAEPFSAEAVATCHEVEEVLEDLREDPRSPWHQCSFELVGTTSGIRDLERVTTADRQLIQLLVAGAVLTVIIVLLRRPVICCYLILTVVLSYLVTLGITDLVFHAIRGSAYAGLDWKVPLFLYVILVAVGQDYNIYLVTRVFEEQRRLGLVAGLRRALIQTGGIITSCGIIMAGTFVSMTTAELNGVVELGFALSLGILLDTFVVRTILVPAMLGWLAKRAEAKEQ